MKRFLAMLLALAMLLGACACAEGVRVTLKDIVAYESGEQIADLTGFCVDLAAATVGEEDSGMRMACRANDQVLMNITLGEAGGKLVMGYGQGNAITDGLHGTAPASLHEGIAGLDLIGDGSWRLTEALAAAIPAECQADGGATRYEGEDCAMTSFEMDEAYMDEMIRAFAAEAELSESQQQQLASLGVDSFEDLLDMMSFNMNVEGGLYDGASMDAAEFNVSMEAMGFPMRITFSIRHTTRDDGHMFALYADIEAEGESLAATANVEAVMDGGDEWLPLEFSGTRELTADDANNIEALIEDFTSGVEPLFNLAGVGAMNVMLNNQLRSGQ